MFAETVPFDFQEFDSYCFASLLSEGVVPSLTDEGVPDGFAGYYSVIAYEDGPRMNSVVLTYFLWDEQGNRVHRVTVTVPAARYEELLPSVQALMSTASWIPLVEPS